MTKFKVGDKVRIKKGIEEPEYKWGGLRNDKYQTGVVRGLNRHFIEVNFPSQSYWKAAHDELERVNPIKLENK